MCKSIDKFLVLLFEKVRKKTSLLLLIASEPSVANLSACQFQISTLNYNFSAYQ